MSDAPYDVLALGCTAVDELLYVPAFPRPDSKMQVRRRERQGGGLSATALVAAARLGARCAFAGVLGDDADSAFVADTLRREGIDLTHTVRRPGARPIHSTIIVDETNHTRTILYDLSGSVGADPERPPAEVLRASRVLFVDHYGIEGMTRAARLARAAGIPVVADFERSDWPGFDQLLDLVDHLILAEGFAMRLTGTAEAVAAINRLWRPDRAVVAVTAGDRGCWYRTADGLSHQPAFRVEVVDSTGCGDVFHGAYAAALAWGWPPCERFRWAAAAAALKATGRGAQAACPRRDAVERFLQQRTRA
ncbi:MAG: PfkB family carbohydrate kinase [Gemmataceae bacterium]|nr:PfkB family carbohydrate kinase [Gemmataceae bacterium]MDW8267023.1 PfkB family carbohydrate kinase [Gemmataceae bacterium]